MNHGGRFSRRLAMAAACFELAAGFGTGSVTGGSCWRICFTLLAPVAIYGLLLPLGARLFEFRAARVAGLLGYLLLAALYQFRHRFPLLSLESAVAFGAFLAGGGILLAPPLRADRWLRWLPPLAAALALAALLLWLRAEDVPWRGSAPTAAPAPGSPNLVLVSWDTVRADVLECYGGSGLSTPNLSQLVSEGLVFDDAVALASITGPSHASMLTGLHPPSHGVRSNGKQGIAAEATTLPEILSAAGYRTGGFVSAYPVLGKFGFARGFEHYDDRLPKGGALLLSKLGRRNFLWLQAATLFLSTAPDASLPGAAVNRRSVAWLDQVAGDGDGRPFFLFVHYYDAHGPFEPPEPWRSEALAAEPLARLPAADASVQDEMTLYRAEIAQLDALLGDLRARLERADPGLQHTLVLLTSDHGECFGEGGILLNHTASLLEATQRVPLILRQPGAAGAGTRVRATATHLDIMPSFLAAARLSVPPGYGSQGLLLNQLEAENPPGAGPRQVYMEAQQYHLGLARKIGWRTGKRKLVRWHSGQEELWAFGAGEVEGEDRSATEAEVLGRLRAALDEFLERIVPAIGEQVELGAEDAASLSALGYAGD